MFWSLRAWYKGRVRQLVFQAFALGAFWQVYAACALLDAPNGEVIGLDPRPGGAGSSGESSAGGAGIDQCAEQRAEAELRPVQLLVLLDHSGSMGDGVHGEAAQKWQPVTDSLQAFFADPAVQGVYASLTLFPPNLNETQYPASEAYSNGDECNEANYVTPQVALTPLPEVQAFRKLIEGVTPPNELRTPTRAALSGAIRQAEQAAAAKPNAATAIVLVTDGEPYCSAQPEPIALTVEVAARASAAFPVYVIGVGEALESLNEVAAAGGTHEAFVVPIDDAERTRRFLLEAIRTIHGEVIPCAAAIPPPPSGKEFDKEKVAVEYITASGVTDITYDPSCSTRHGWRYDDVNNPSLVQVCDATCSTLQRLQVATLRIVFACQSVLDLGK
jgi:hypothetical protein